MNLSRNLAMIWKRVREFSGGYFVRQRMVCSGSMISFDGRNRAGNRNEVADPVVTTLPRKIGFPGAATA